MSGSRRTALYAALAALAASPAVAFAQEHAEEGGGGGIFSLDVGLMVWTWLLFLLTLFVLAWKVFPAISGGLEARHARIQASIDEAHEARDEAKALLEQQRAALDAARRESQEMIDGARAAAEGVRKEILAEARSQQEALIADARREIDQEREKLRDDLRQEAVEISLAAAEWLIRKRLDADEDRRLVRDFVAEIRP